MQEVAQIISELTDPGECWYDHHGYCQAHYLQEDCVVPRARKMLEKLEALGFVPE